MPISIKIIARPATAALLIWLLFHCSAAPAAAPDGALPGDLGPNASIIRNPADGGFDNLDTVNVARLSFAGSTYEFGTVDAGAVVKHTFPFSNTGRVPLLITGARSTCGCTVPSYPTAPISPGESGVIEVAFDTKNKSGFQKKPITITANTYPSTTTLFVTGRVDK